MKLPNEILRDLREDKDIKQDVVAKLVGVSQQQYSRYETGESELPLRAFMLLADFYDVSADFLIGRKGDYYNVPGLEQKVTKSKTAKDMLADIMSLDSVSRAAVLDYIFLQQLKEEHYRQKGKS